MSVRCDTHAMPCRTVPRDWKLNRLKKEASGPLSTPRDDGISFSSVDDNLFHWEAVFPGPSDTPYEQGMFRCSMHLSEDYPMKPPKFLMLTKVWHYFFDVETGEVCVDLLQDEWRPSWTIEAIVVSVQSLLSEPLHEDQRDEALNLSAATLWMEDKTSFNLVARHYTSIYASLDCHDLPSGVVLCKKRLNSLVVELQRHLDKNLIDRLLQLVKRTRTSREFDCVYQTLQECVSRPAGTDREVHQLEEWFDDPDFVKSPRNTISESLTTLRPKIEETLYTQCVQLVETVSTESEIRLAEKFFAQCLVWPVTTERELNLLEERLNQERTSSDAAHTNEEQQLVTLPVVSGQQGQNWSSHTATHASEEEQLIVSGVNSRRKRGRWRPSTGASEGQHRAALPVVSWWKEEVYARPSVGVEIELFIAHHGEDAKETLAKPLHYIMKSLGVSSFVDQKSITPGERVVDELAEGLHYCKYGVVVISDHFLDSYWCRKELNTLYRRFKNREDDFKLLVIFESRRLIDEVPAFYRLKEVGALVVRSPGSGDRKHLIDEIIPRLLWATRSRFPQLYEQRNDTKCFSDLLDEYLADPSVTVPASLRPQAHGV